MENPDVNSINSLDAQQQNEHIYKAVTGFIADQYPIVTANKTLELKDLLIDEAEAPDSDLPLQKKMKVEGRTWAVPVYGHFILRDNKTGEVIDELPKIKILNLPKITQRFSMLINGNEYQTTNQLRLKSGIYTRLKNNGDYESQFNLAKGFNFKLLLTPSKGVFMVKVGTQHYRLYSLLKALDLPDQEMLETWGRDLYTKNSAQGLEENSWFDLVEKLVHERPKDIPTAKSELKKYFANTELDPETTAITLGKAFSTAQVGTWLAASKKLLQVQRGEERPDERDSLVFKNLMTPDDSLGFFLEKKEKQIKGNLRFRTEKKDKIREILSADTYSKPVKAFFTTGDLTSTPAQTNPAAILSEWRKTTILGQGGVVDMNSINMETRNVHPSQMNYLDPVNTPDSGRVGVTLPLSMYVQKDKKGNMTAPIITKDGKTEMITPSDFWERKIGFASQYKLSSSGKPIPSEEKVNGTYRGDPTKFNKTEVEGYLLKPQGMFGWPSNLTPFMENTQGNRALMASKNLVQAFAIDKNEAPLVQVKMPLLAKTFEQSIGSYLNPYVPDEISSGTVTSVDKDYVHIKDSKGEKHKVGLYNHFPMNQESFLQSTPLVKAGDRVKKGQELASNNFEAPDASGEKALSLGRNVQVAYMPYKGYTFEDGFVATESFAKDFGHTVLHNFSAHRTTKGVFDRDKLAAEYPNIFINPGSYNKLTVSGVVKEGTKVKKGDVLIAHLEPREFTDEQKVLRNMNRAIARIYDNRSVIYDFDEPGEVMYVNRVGRKFVVRVKVSHPLVEGDKLSGRYGNKGIVVKLIPDEEAPHTKDGKRIDLIMSPFGVPSRMNPSQLLEVAAAKIAEKTGKPFVMENFTGDNHVEDIMAELKKHNIEADEVILDKKGGKPLKSKVFTGPKYIMKLMHVIEHKEKSRSYGSYNVNEAPGRGASGGQAIDPMLSYSLLAHGAKANLRDFSTIKSQQNDELWRALQLGQPLPTPNKPFVFEKMMNYMRAAGVDHVKQGSTIQLLPMTDSKVKEVSQGKLTDAGQMLIGKNLSAIKGGLFDTNLTGGNGGKKWTHLELSDRIPSPIFAKAIQSVLGINGPAYEKMIDSDMKGLLSKLTDLDPVEELKAAKKELQSAPESKVNGLHKKVRFLNTLVENKLDPADAYTIKNLPVLPPVYRPIYPLPSGDLMTSPINNHYRAVSLINAGLDNDKKSGAVGEEKLSEIRSDLYKHVSELQGLTDLQHYGKERYEGLLKTLAGSEPKEGFIQNNVWSKRQDLSARSTITLEPNLGVDEVGIPTGMAKDIFGPFAVQKLARLGHNPLQAKKEIQDDTALGLRGLDLAMNERPVLLNRAPSLHKHSIQSFRGKRMDGSAVRLNPLIVAGFNADFDGDAMAVFTPVSEKAVEEAYGMLPSKNLYQYGPHLNNPKMPIVDSFSQTYQQGLWDLSRSKGKYKGDSFKSVKEAAKALKDETIDEQTPIEIAGLGRTTYGKELILSKLPKKMQDRSMDFSSKNVSQLMARISVENKDKFGEVMNHFKDLGNRYSYKNPLTLSISDLAFDRSDREAIMSAAHKKAAHFTTKDGKAKVYNQASLDVQDALFKKARAKNNRFFNMLDSGAQGKPDSIRQVLTMPGILNDVHGNPITIPVERSWAEGVPDHAYWNHLYAARKGTVDRAVNTQDSGALNKALLTNLKDLLIVEDDCETKDGIDYPADDKNIMGRISLGNYVGVNVGDAITPAKAAVLSRKLKDKPIKVRSPLTCESVHGICSTCYGLTPDGKLPRVGENVGILDGQSVSEKSTQLTMNSFHTGGSSLVAGGISAGFPELQRTLEMPATLPGKATLATSNGKVTAVEKGSAGGYDVTIAGKVHPVGPGRKVLVKPNQWVARGMAISSGTEKPQEVAELRGFLDAQRGLVNRMNDVYENKYAKRTFETVIRGISNNAMITDAPEDSEFIRGGTAKRTAVKAENKRRETEGLKPIGFKSYFKSIQVLPHEKDDWLSRVTSNNIKRIVQESAARGAKTNIHGYDPHPSYLYGAEFGEEFDPEKGVFW